MVHQLSLADASGSDNAVNSTLMSLRRGDKRTSQPPSPLAIFHKLWSLRT